MPLRDEIAQRIYESTTLDQHGESQALADELIALFRERMLRTDVLSAVGIEVFASRSRRVALEYARDTITIALDAITKDTTP